MFIFVLVGAAFMFIFVLVGAVFYRQSNVYICTSRCCILQVIPCLYLY